MESAFPRIEHDSCGNPIKEHSGMTLRDWFAGQALAGILSNSTLIDSHTRGTGEWAAEHAYMQADAMLKARNA